MFKEALYKMFMDQNLYPVFYEIYKRRHKFSHMQLECVPLKKKIGELAPIYFKVNTHTHTHIYIKNIINDINS